MRLTIGLLLFSLGVTMSRETSAEQITPSNDTAIVRGDNQFAVEMKVPLMHLKSKLGYAEEETFQVLELPYVGRDLSMVAFLPKKVDGLPELEKMLTVDKLNSQMSTLHVREVNAYLPKFKLETSFGLNSAAGDGDEAGVYARGRLLGHQQRGSPLHLRRAPQGVRGCQ